MSKFKKYRRKQIAELRPVTEADITRFNNHKVLHIEDEPFEYTVSITDNDFFNGSPKMGDMIARNPKENKDQWLISEQYFKDNFEEVRPDPFINITSIKDMQDITDGELFYVDHPTEGLVDADLRDGIFIKWLKR